MIFSRDDRFSNIKKKHLNATDMLFTTDLKPFVYKRCLRIVLRRTKWQWVRVATSATGWGCLRTRRTLLQPGARLGF